ncbi:MAG: 50S ribosomal protein L4, partial [Nitrososphaerota archaeon]|nr:50S ribosomal protein L4 [Nitrososphaerota archaeon]
MEGKEVGSLDLPSVFKTPVREDVINRVYVALASHGRIPQGRDPLAGERTTAEAGNPPTGRGISRIPRTKGEHYSKSGMAGAVASIVHGRLPHPPRSEKVIRKRVNNKERHLALASAIAATANTELVTKRGHKFSAKLPIVVSDDLENVG